MGDNQDASSTEAPFTKRGFLSGYNVPTNLTQGQHKAVVIFLILLTFFLLYQTRMCTELMGRIFIARSTLRWHIEKSMQLRREVAAKSLGANASATPMMIVPHRVFFGDGEDSSPSKLINDVIKTLHNDQSVCDNFPSFDNIPLTQTSAIIVPLRKMAAAADRKQMGITDAGWVCSDDDSTLEPGAVTIREKPVGNACFKRLEAKSVQYDKTEDGTPQMTADGTPRIALSDYPLKDADVLKMTILHELMHVHDAPPYRPFLNFVHDDLTYLPEYNAMLRNGGLLRPWSFKWKQEAALWAVLSVILLGIVINAYRAGWWIRPKPLSSV